MTVEQRKQYHRDYTREYRQEGFGAVNDRRYYLAHRAERLEQARKAYLRKKAGKLSQDSADMT